MKTYFVYILECYDKTYYTGFTSNLTLRIIEHNSGKHKDSYTYSKRPLNLVFYCEFTEADLAIDTEKQIKKWSRAKKEALIKGIMMCFLIWLKKISTSFNNSNSYYCHFE